jgi:hypothetical protein
MRRHTTVSSLDREQALSITPCAPLRKKIRALRYCLAHPEDVPALSINLHAAQRSPLLSTILRSVSQKNGLISGYESSLSLRNAEIPLANPFYTPTTSTPPFIFIGVNHTGSWSLHEAMEQSFGPEHFFTVESYTYEASTNAIPPLQAQLQALKQQLATIQPKFIYCHTALPVHLALTYDYAYATMLRNPCSRLISVYYWTRKYRDKDVHWIPQIIKRGASLSDYIDYIADTGDYPGGLHPAQYFFDNWHSCGLIPKEFCGDHLNGTAHVLDNYFNFVGITEVFEESLFCFAGKLNLPYLPYWKLRGKSNRPSIGDIDPSIIRKIDKLTSVDMELYFRFRRRFEENYREQIKYFRRRIKTLRLADHKTDGMFQ